MYLYGEILDLCIIAVGSADTSDAESNPEQFFSILFDNNYLDISDDDCRLIASLIFCNLVLHRASVCGIIAS